MDTFDLLNANLNIKYAIVFICLPLEPLGEHVNSYAHLFIFMYSLLKSQLKMEINLLHLVWVIIAVTIFVLKYTSKTSYCINYN